MSLMLAVLPAFGQVPPGGARLSYTRGSGADGCPEEQALRDVVAAQLGGIDPFVDGGSGGRRVEVVVARKRRHFLGEIALYDSDGRRLGGQEVTSATCGALVEDVGTALAIMLRPVRSAREPAPSPPSAPAPAERASAPSPPETVSPGGAPAGSPRAPAAAPLPPCQPAAPARSAERRGPSLAWPRLQAGAGALITEGLAPARAVGFSAFVGARWEAFSLSLEGRMDLPVATEPYRGGIFGVSWLGGSIVPCSQMAWFFGCGLVTAGRVRYFGMVNAVGEASLPYAGLGVRGGVEVPLSYSLAARLSGELVANLVRPTFHLRGSENWSVAGSSKVGALQLLASF
ncbi:hypothetical protein [Sorangium atrum]|uniref:Secreted protein n=1 Tax=Sorangium atrum TaxID=2995308 RepID=A0ABT5BVG2_9BACT|nr:hypothetical protein [Sorangium aterium]MDC0678154.1 hypothetical protein [Sorangium aterium]